MPPLTMPASLYHEAMNHGQNPRVHPNGFIQLDLAPVEDGWGESKKRGHSGAARRLHIWNPPGIELPRQETVNEIHDHVFDMRSTVIKGVIVQKLYWFVVGGIYPPTHELYRAVYDKASDSRLERLGVSGYLRCWSEFSVRAGDNYMQPAFSLHDSEAQGTVVTVMEKTQIHEGDATVVCPLGQSPDNEFKRDEAAPADVLWDAIERSLLA